MTELAATIEAPPSSRPRRAKAKQQHPVRRLVMIVSFAVLTGVIASYWIITDPQRVRSMAETYLSALVGGRVQVDRASLSVFEGLRLEGISVYVDDPAKPGALIFTARTFLVRTNLRALLAGRLEASQIMAVDPHVRICENLDATQWQDQWNYRRLNRPRTPKTVKPGAKPITLPEILLRAGLIQYNKIKDGKHEFAGALAIDGQLNPVGQDHYLFDLDSRAPGQNKGPHINGVLQMGVPGVSAKLQDFEFNDTIRVMLPSQVRNWWDEHQLAGKIKIPKFYFSRGKPGDSPVFEIELQLENVSFTVPPEDLLGSPDVKDLQLWPVPSPLLANLVDMRTVGRLRLPVPAPQPQPITLKNVDGRFVFTPEHIRLEGIRGKIEDNTVTINGRIDGYSAAAPMNVSITASNIFIPRQPRYLASLPQQIRKIYDKFRPSGWGSLALTLNRNGRGERLHAAGSLTVRDGGFCFNEFAYPLRHVTGVIAFGPDANSGKDRVDLLNLRGFGVDGSLNAETSVIVNGWIAPLDKGSAVRVHVVGKNVSLDEHVRAALPREARQSIELFDHMPRPGASPLVEPVETVPVQIHGDFECLVLRPPGPKRKVQFDVGLNIDRAEGAFKTFAYPLRQVAGHIRVRNKQVDITNITARTGDATLLLNGDVRWGHGRPVEPTLRLEAKNVPIDQDLLASIPASPRQWLQKLDIHGMINAAGRIYLPENAADTGDTDFDLRMLLHDGSAKTLKEGTVLTDAAADLSLTRNGLTLHGFTGKRGSGRIEGSGTISWPEDHPDIALTVKGTDIPTDSVLYQIIPADARHAWDQLRPSGPIDLQVTYTGQPDDATGEPAPKGPYEIIIWPKGASVTPVAFPYLMHDLAGTITITPDRIALDGITARHGQGTLTFSGSGAGKGPAAWDLHLTGKNIAVDDELLAAVPKGLRSVMTAVKLGGKFAFDTPNLKYRTVDVVSPKAPTTQASRIEFTTRIGVSDGSLDVGLPLTSVSGGAELTVTVLGGDLDSLSAKLHAPDLLVAERPMKDLRCDVRKLTSDKLDAYQFLNLHGKFAGGELAGQVDLAVPKDESPSSYGLRMILRNVDVARLVGETGQEIKGQLTGSLDLAGHWADPASRRGRGDVQVQGKQLYQIPVILGVLQIANLSLPIKGPFNEATTRYSILGQKIVFEQIELRAPSFLMQGNGLLDFAARRVSLTFTTDNPGRLRIPVWDDFVKNVQKELLQIRVQGTIEEPQVKARSLATFTTTIDEVFKDQPRPAQQKK